jgi:hypothetical protein
MDFPISFAPVTEWMTAMMEVPVASQLGDQPARGRLYLE